MVLSALRDYPVDLTSVVSMADDGGSTGRLRDQYGVLPPGDIRRALVALSNTSKTLRDLFNYRFKGGDLKEHSFGNIFLSALEKITGSFGESVDVASKILNIKGQVLPVTLSRITLCAELANNSVIRGETNIDIRKKNPEVPIKKVWLEPAASINPRAKKAILGADMIVIGPGDLFTSLIPNFLVRGMSAVLKKSSAKKVYVCNLMTKMGETQGFKAPDFVVSIEKYLGKGVLGHVIFNNKKPSNEILKKYSSEKSFFIEPPDAFTSSNNTKYICADLLDGGRFVRHNPRKKLAKVLISLL